jgi:hypothetical protein
VVTQTEGYGTLDHGTNVAARLINLFGGIIIGLLGLRFVLMLLGANRGNAVVDMIYGISYPFAAPFFGMFGYTAEFGRSRFEFETLVAMVAYALITWLLIRLVTLPNRHVEV